MDYKFFIHTTFDSYKCKSILDEYRFLPIYNDNNLVGFLRPVTFFYKQIYPEYISLICKWRKENPIGFANVFENTEQKTENWFDNILLPREDRILFMIYNLKYDPVYQMEFSNFDPVGHLGFSNFDFDIKSCELDNVVRGVKEDNKGIMSLAVNALILWGKKTLNLNDIYLRVLSDNTYAIKFYEKLGFYFLYNIPLFKRETEELTEWIELEDMKDKTPDRFYSYMKLNG